MRQQVHDRGDPVPTIIFLHVPKTAGWTLSREIFERQYRHNEIYRFQSLREFDEIPPGARSQMKVIYGHMGFGLHKLLPRPATYITILRDPVERVISFYYFLRRYPKHPLHPATRTLTLEEFVSSGLTTEVDNAQTRYLAGPDAEPAGYSFGECPREALDMAMHNLQDHFGVVGIVEDFDRTLLLMMIRFGWKLPVYYKRNVTRGRPIKTEISADALRVIEKHNLLDRELYEFGRRLFDDAVASNGPRIGRELARLQLWKTFVAPVLHLSRRVGGFGRSRFDRLANWLKVR